MNVAFLTMSNIQGIEYQGIYSDLMRRFRNEGHQLYIVAPRERRTGKRTHLEEVDGVQILGVRTLNLQKTNIIEKGVGQVLVESQFKKAIKRHLSDIKLDLILYSTPPISLMGVVKYLKLLNPKAISYLLLKDIFPQNAVDIGMLKKTGIKGLLYKHFRKQEKQLYELSDFIGCMSPANVDYVLHHNPELDPIRVEVAPNSYEIQQPEVLSDEQRELVRMKYGLPVDRLVFVYGGNLGKPQGISFMMKCLEANANRSDCFFVVIGNGTELPKLKEWYAQKKPKNVVVKDGLSKEEYKQFVRSCDVGLIFLDHRFTIPNFPSRLLSYLENKMPVLCSTDPYCDMGKIAEKNGFGFWCESNSVDAFTVKLDDMIHADRIAMGEKGYSYLCDNYLVDNTYNAIVRHV